MDIEKAPIISSEEVNTIVKKDLNLKIIDNIDFTIEPLSLTEGYLGKYSIIKANISIPNKEVFRKYFIKAVPSDQSIQEFLTLSGSVFKENAFYQTIIPLLKNEGINLFDNVPECYLVRFNELIVFEDLSVKGYRTHNERTAMDFERVKLVVEALAKLHSSVLIFEEKKTQELGTCYRIINHFSAEFKESFLNNSSSNTIESAKKGLITMIDYFSKEYADVNLKLFKQRAVEHCDNLSILVKPSTKYRNSFSHGDLWVNNLLFKYENKKPISCKIIDFQSYRYNTPAQDLMSFLYFSTNRKFRCEYKNIIINLYYEELKKNLNTYNISIENVITYKDFLDSVEAATPFAIAHACLLFFGAPKEELTLLSPEDFKKLWNEDRSEFLLKFCDSDDIFKEVQRGVVLDFKNLCFNK